MRPIMDFTLAAWILAGCTGLSFLIALYQLFRPKPHPRAAHFFLSVFVLFILSFFAINVWLRHTPLKTPSQRDTNLPDSKHNQEPTPTQPATPQYVRTPELSQQNNQNPLPAPKPTSTENLVAAKNVPTPTPIPTEIAKPAQPVDSGTAEIGQFIFSIDHCLIFSASYNPDSNVLVSQTAGKVDCQGTVTNQGSDHAVIQVDDRKTNIIDNLGNQSISGIIYNMSKSVVRIGNAKTWGARRNSQSRIGTITSSCI